jgi:hypothetical protein
MSGFEDFRARLFVIQFSTPHVPVFDTHGELITELGRSGSGPGTFLLPSGVGAFGDSVWVSDARLRKIAVYDSGLKHVRDVIPTQQALRPVGMLASDEWIAIASTPTLTEWFGVVSDRAQLLYSQRTESRVINYEYNQRFSSLLNPFSDGALVVSTSVGGGIVVLEPLPEHVGLRHISVTGIRSRPRRYRSRHS